MKIKGLKLKMTQIWGENDAVFGVTPVKFEPNTDLSGIKEGELVMVSGLTKGRGFQGGVKRHGFHGGPKTHGQKNRHRAPGSIGSTAPQRVLPGRKMAGHMGMTTATSKNIKIVKIEEALKMIYLNGSAPGHIGTKVVISKK